MCTTYNTRICVYACTPVWYVVGMCMYVYVSMYVCTYVCTVRTVLTLRTVLTVRTVRTVRTVCTVPTVRTVRTVRLDVKDSTIQLLRLWIQPIHIPETSEHIEGSEGGSSR